MKCFPYDGGPFEWIVRSETRKEIEHLVNISARGGNGDCSCEAFQFRHVPNLKRGMAVSRCKHIKAAREAFTDYIIKTLEKDHT